MGAIHMRAWPRSRRRTIALHLCGEQRVGTVSPRRRPDRRTTTARRRRRWRQVTRLLEHLLTAAGAGGRPGRVIEILGPQALTHHAAGHPGCAVAAGTSAGPWTNRNTTFGGSSVTDQGWRHCHRSGDLRMSRSAPCGGHGHRHPARPGARPGLDHHVPIVRVTTSITPCGDAGSPHRLLPFEHTNKWPGD